MSKLLSARKLAVAPLILLLLLLLLILYDVLDIGGASNPRWLFLSLNTTFVSLASFLATYLTAQAYVATGQMQLAWIGGGLLTYGLASLLSALGTVGQNVAVTVHNTGALLSSILFLVGALTAVSWSLPSGIPRRRFSSLTFIFGAAVAVVLLVFLFSSEGITPTFFIPEQGGTQLREIVLNIAIALFVISGFSLLTVYRRSKSAFLYFFSLGLLLIALSLLAADFAETLGDSVSWLARSAQYIGGVYFLIAVVSTVRESRAVRADFTKVVSTIFPASAQSYRFLIDTTAEAVIALNREGRIALWNSSAEEMFGYSSREAVGHLLVGLIVPERHKDDTEEWMIGAEIDSPVTTRELTLRRRDGHEIPAEVSLSTRLSSLARLKAFVVRDISERKQAEEAQARQRQIIETIMENTEANIAYLDTDFKFVMANRAYIKGCGHSWEELVGRSHFDIFPDEENWVIFQWVKATGEPASFKDKPFEFTHQPLRGVTYWDWTLVPVKDSQGKVTGLVLSLIDTTERKKLDMMKDQFIDMVSHELRTPLTIVTGSLYTFQSEELATEQKQELLRDALSGTEQLGQILENLLELSRAQMDRLTLHKEPLNISELARAVVNKLQYKSTGHQFVIDIPPEPAVRADPVRIELVLRNLVDNAIKYSPSGGQVRVFARRDGDDLVVGVSDEGVGISPEDQAKLFTRFQRLEESVRTGTEGIGLGLSVCRTLVEVHGGRIWVESRPGHGSTFSFTIPINMQSSAA